MIARRALTAAVLCLCLVGSGCGADTSAREDTAQVRQPILGGSSSDETQDHVVMIFNHDPAANRRVAICTGALVAPRLVLTARHCVSIVSPDLMACEVDGRPIRGGAISGNYAPANLYVFAGKDRPEHIGETPETTSWRPSGQGLEIVADDSTTLCDHDLALLVLKAPIENIPPASLRLDGDAAAGEKLLTVGWGVSSGEIEPRQRQQRRDVNVTRVGPSADIPTLTKSEFLFDESICLGDSGGPIFSQQTNAIVGVVSRGGNGADPGQGGPAYTCEDADNVGTKVSPFRDLVMRGFERAGAQPKLEAKPDDDGCRAAPVGTRHGRLGQPLALALAALALARRRLLLPQG